MSNLMSVIIISAVIFACIGSIGWVFSEKDNVHSTRKRMRKMVSKKKGKSKEHIARQSTQNMIKDLRVKEQGVSNPLQIGNLGHQIKQAGLQISVQVFLLIFAGFSMLVAFLLFRVGVPVFIIITISISLFLGAPRWALSILIKARQKKITDQFADAIDVIVRGVKSGLPLGECLKVLALETPEPLSSEFEAISDTLSMGGSMESALGKFYERVPLPEVNFFNIVLLVQQKYGGNLSEALGNLSSVLRSRKLLKAKIGALSAEAKMSSIIIAILPIAVGAMTYVMSPDYIMLLFTTSLGNVWLGFATLWMGLGVFTITRMSKFEV